MLEQFLTQLPEIAPILADWLDDHNEPELAIVFRYNLYYLILDDFLSLNSSNFINIHVYGDGSGYGYGHGNGNGYVYSNGNGYGYGYSAGLSCCYGNGSGYHQCLINF